MATEQNEHGQETPVEVNPVALEKAAKSAFDEGVEIEMDKLEGNGGSGGNSGGGTGGEGDKGGAGGAGSYTFSPMWNDLAKKLGTEEKPWDIPANVKEGKFDPDKTELDVLIETIHANTDYSQLPELQNPTVREYLAASQQEGFDEKAWFAAKAQEQSIRQLKGGDFIRAFYTKFKGKNEENPDGYTEEDINAYIASKNRIDLDREAGMLMKQLDEYDRAMSMKVVTEGQEKARIQFEQEENQILQRINTFIEKKKPTSEFFGIELSEAEKTQFVKELPGLFKRDPKTGLSEFDTIMQSEDTMLELAALVWLKDKGLKGKISALKETIKAEIEGKLGTARRVDGGQPGGTGENPDASVLND